MQDLEPYNLKNVNAESMVGGAMDENIILLKSKVKIRAIMQEFMPLNRNPISQLGYRLANNYYQLFVQLLSMF
jgi:hypothetical protein